MNYSEIITKMVQVLVSWSAPFTVYDITRLLQFKNPGVNVDHNMVRQVVENLFFGGQLGHGYTRDIGNQLNGLNPKPQIYYCKSNNGFNAYDRNQLDPSRLPDKYAVKLFDGNSYNHQSAINRNGWQTKIVKELETNNLVTLPVLSTTVFALKLKGKNVWRKPYSRGKGSTTNFGEASTYLTKNGPTQLLRSSDHPERWEVVKYKLSFTAVK